MVIRYLAVMLGGAFGSLARYALGLAIMSRYAGQFPVATCAINVTGSFLIGFALTVIPDRPPGYLRPLIVTGVLGGYTTFSAFEWEAYASPRGIASAYILASVGLGFLACWCGAALGRILTD